LLLLSPETPLLFMGEEYAEQAPFQFFVDFGDPNLQKAVVEGRKSEFKEFGWNDIPDPQDPETFQRSKLTWRMDEDMLAWYRRLLQLRHQFVTHSSRTCRARLSDHEIAMEVPAETGGITVVVALPGRKQKPDQPESELLLHASEDDYSVCVFPTVAQARATEPLKGAA